MSDDDKRILGGLALLWGVVALLAGIFSAFMGVGTEGVALGLALSGQALLYGAWSLEKSR